MMSLSVIRVLTLTSLVGGLAACDGEEKVESKTADLKKCDSTFYGMAEKETGGTVMCKIKPGCAEYSGLFGSNPFMVNSGPCSAAIYAGLLKDEEIGLKIEFFERKDEEIVGGEANGIKSATPEPQPDSGTMLLKLSLIE